MNLEVIYQLVEEISEKHKSIKKKCEVLVGKIIESLNE
jgi:hypothetical protein